jgi:putative membrane protein
MTSLPIAWGGFAIFGGLLGLAFWILVIVAIVALIRGSRPAAGPSGGPAVHLLEERYARGEITREEFLERRTVLQQGSAGPLGNDAQ